MGLGGLQSPHSCQYLVSCIRQMLGHVGSADQYICAGKQKAAWQSDQHKSAQEAHVHTMQCKQACT